MPKAKFHPCCTQCGEKNPAKFTPSKYTNSGYQTWCKACTNAQQRGKRNYKAENARRAEWRKNNPEKVREQSRKAQARHREKQAALMAEFQEWLKQRKEAQV